ncbi:DUF421 domain-containing protein [Ornithinibacillus massiliensis]|uniref:DUF421 domain-containing protein n=1 Tax=Ornithinibacillus massiliensis TaxID=1944633 RepID=A0ABS5M9A6_9BACI|nr:DUF421 domain-containing protein [Ornithinibacillus massiliensis]MBS3678896.1 DUF421 domain-containing protein [Ornithinibacillus massiliensis]
MTLTELIIRSLIGFLVLFTLTRIMGRKEISQMTFFNFVSAIAIGSIAASLVVNKNLSILNGVMALVGWAIFTLIMGVIDLKSKTLRKVVTGNPVIVIKEGKVLTHALRSTRLDLDSLTAMLRQQHIFSLTDVDYAIFETNGKLSVMLKENANPLTKKDMNIPTAPATIPIPTAVISDGKLLTENLEGSTFDQSWLEKELKQHNINSISDVLYAQIQKDGTLYIQKKTLYRSIT